MNAISDDDPNDLRKKHRKTNELFLGVAEMSHLLYSADCVSFLQTLRKVKKNPFKTKGLWGCV
jgi:hypothetical protein